MFRSLEWKTTSFFIDTYYSELAQLYITISMYGKKKLTAMSTALSPIYSQNIHNGRFLLLSLFFAEEETKYQMTDGTYMIRFDRLYVRKN